MKSKVEKVSISKNPVGSLIRATFKAKTNEEYIKGKDYTLRTNQADEYDNLTKGWVLIAQKEDGSAVIAYKQTEDFLKDWYIVKIIGQWEVTTK